jgi:hypothetical protein
MPARLALPASGYDPANEGTKAATMSPTTGSIANYRLTRTRLAAGLVAALVGFVLVFLVLTRFPGGSVPLLTGVGHTGGGCYLNYFVDELVVDPVNGTAVIEEYTIDGQPKSRVLPIMWPVGYTARHSGSEVEVLARNGQVVARTGATYRIQGGYEGDYWLTCGMTPMLNWTPDPVL